VSAYKKSGLSRQNAVSKNALLWAPLQVSALLLIVMLLITLPGCAFLRLQKDLDRLDTAATVRGTLATPEGSSGPFVVAIIKRSTHSPMVRNYWFNSSAGEFMFLVEPGQYSLLGFEDRNRNSVFDQGEAVGELGGESPLELTAASVSAVGELRLRLGGSLSSAGRAALEANQSGTSLLNTKVSIGEQTTLLDPAFVRENASKGFWQPLTFITTVKSGLFLLQPYDRKKIPVIFVHGASGTPLDFSSIIKSLDTQRYQPWVFYYPSGFPLSLCADYLAQTVGRTAAKHNVSSLIVIAHSMGGLVARSFVSKDLSSSGAHLTKLFISLSSPFNGHEAAESGVENAPAVIPSWRDMVPNSPFLTKLFEAHIPSSTSYYLMFGYRGRGLSFSDNNDGVVTLKSVLRPEAQREAVRIFGFDADHTGILENSEAIRTLNALLSGSSEASS